jgi:hypothetical protein
LISETRTMARLPSHGGGGAVWAKAAGAKRPAAMTSELRIRMGVLLEDAEIGAVHGL